MNRALFFLVTLTLTTMISSCNKGGLTRSNPLLEIWDTPYQTPPFEHIADRDYLPAIEEAIDRHNEEIEIIINSTLEPDFKSVILPLDDSGILLKNLSSIFSMKQLCDTSPELQKANEAIMPLLSAHEDAIIFNKALFDKVKIVYDKRNSLNLSEIDQRLLDKIYNSFVRKGALLDEQSQERMSSINSEISRLSVLFGNNTLAESNSYSLLLEEEDLVGLSKGLKSVAANRAKELGFKDKSAITLHPSSWIPFLTYSQRRDLREEVYRAYTNRANNDNEFSNKDIATQIARLRAEKAELLGFNNYAEFATSFQMAKSPEAATALVERVYTAALERAEADLELLNEEFLKDHPNEEFASWDWWYYIEKLRKKSFNTDEDEYKPYFSVDGVRRGAFTLANRLFGITFRPVPVEHYNQSCTAYEVLDIDNSHLGVLYLDLYTRPTKQSGAWCEVLREQRYEDGTRIAPIVAIACNFTASTSGTPSQLTPSEVQTLFHEFGHAMHFILQDSPYRTLNSVEGDFVEFPSQLFENWAFEPELLKLYAIHNKTNSVMPNRLITHLAKSATFNQGFKTTELAAAALSDLDIHSLSSAEIGNDFDITAFEMQSLNQKRGLIEQIEPRYRYTYFNHIFNGDYYSAGYYFYLWAEVLEKDGYRAFTKSGDPFNRDVAKRLRKSILERGGTRDGMNMYREFRGGDPSVEALLEARGLNRDEN